MAFSTSIHDSAPAESRASLKTMLNLCRVEPGRSQDVQQLATASVFFGFCIALKKSGTSAEGSAVDDERRCLRVHGGR